MPVLAIGGLFFRAEDPDSLAAWYRDHLNVGAGCAAAGEPDEHSWKSEGGPVVFCPFPSDSDYFPAEKAFMLNFRVSDLETLIDKLESQGVAVTTKPEWDHPDLGRFARIHDPEGNPIELWEQPKR